MDSTKGRLSVMLRDEVLLSSPDGSRSLGPADWTDLPGWEVVAASEPSTQAALLSTVADLLQAHPHG
jgi:hypothetical protein